MTKKTTPDLQNKSKSIVNSTDDLKAYSENLDKQADPKSQKSSQSKPSPKNTAPKNQTGHSGNTERKRPEQRPQQRQPSQVSPRQRRILNRNDRLQENTYLDKHDQEDDRLNSDSESDFHNNQERNKQKKENQYDDNTQHEDIRNNFESDLDCGQKQPQKGSQYKLGKNSYQHMKLLHQFCQAEEDLNNLDLQAQKSLVKETIVQMFDQFILGTQNLLPSTPEHHIFGRGAQLCQKILVAFNHNNMTEAKQLIDKLIPKKYKK